MKNVAGRAQNFKHQETSWPLESQEDAWWYEHLSQFLLIYSCESVLGIRPAPSASLSSGWPKAWWTTQHWVLRQTLPPEGQHWVQPVFLSELQLGAGETSPSQPGWRVGRVGGEPWGGTVGWCTGSPSSERCQGVHAMRWTVSRGWIALAVEHFRHWGWKSHGQVPVPRNLFSNKKMVWLNHRVKGTDGVNVVETRRLF